MISGYARVSPDGQSLDAQLFELKVAGCQKIFQEKISGARCDRLELAWLTEKIGKHTNCLPIGPSGTIQSGLVEHPPRDQHKGCKVSIHP
jgi:hypothetical protein